MTKQGEPSVPQPDLAQLAREKLSRVIGAMQAQRVFAQALAAAKLTDIRTPDDLYRFGEQLAKQGGFEAAVGRLLTVAAVIRGASGSSRP
jgi:hypothetical protein